MLRVLHRRVNPKYYNGRLYSSPSLLNESGFESLAVKELTDLAHSIETEADKIGVDSVDLHEGVLSLEFPNGVFVLNRHLASRQIWYSSPVSPPAYFDLLQDKNNIWWSARLNMTLRSKLSLDIEKLTKTRLVL
jgi:frataxin-like iron-binding protein CyaY